MRTPILSITFCAVLLLVVPGASWATILGTVEVTHSDYGAHDITAVWGAGETGMTTHAGVYMLNKSAGTGEGNIWPNGALAGFCIELNEDAPDDIFQYDVVMPEDAQNSFLGSDIGTEKADYLRELWGRFYDPAWEAGGPYSFIQNINAEAFAIAVWEIIYEALPTPANPWDVTSDGTPGPGGFECFFADMTTANNWLSQLDGTGPMADLRILVHNGQQDYLVAVPEPASMILLGLGGLLTLRRKMKAIS